MKLTYQDLLNLESCLSSAIYNFDNKICELKQSKLSEDSERKRLQLTTKARDDYSALYHKLKEMEREVDNATSE